MTKKYYKERIDNAASYNSRLCSEKKLRLPFLDSQTGVAQNHSNLWMLYRYRSPGQFAGQIYSYPARRWRKRKRAFIPSPDVHITKASDIETGEADMHQISAVENPAVIPTEPEVPPDPTPVLMIEPLKNDYYDEWDDISDPPDAGEIDAHNSDSSDFEQTYIKKRKKKVKANQKSGGRGRKSTGIQKEDRESTDDKVIPDKPFGCDMCGARYKTRPGLTYHLSHAHLKPEVAAPPPETQPPHLECQVADEDKAFTPPPAKTSLSAREGKPHGRASPNNYCDFCLGLETDNKKTGEKEPLFSCADCGHSGHPSCLQFTPNMIISVQKYPWQCIECKSCGLCGTSDNDDQLLFCDDCDRGYHMYCLKPPLSEPPEGSWSCHLCVVEFHSGKK